MDIKYMQKLAEHPTIGSFTNKGMSDAEIQVLEQSLNHGNQFPLAFREFLWLGGKFDVSCVLNGQLTYLQEGAKRTLEEIGQTLGSDFLAFNHFEDFSQFHFFYLNDSGEDPKTYICYGLLTHDGEPLMRDMHRTFSEFVNFRIELRLRGETP